MFISDLSKNEMDAIRFCIDKLEENKQRTFIELGVYYGCTIKTILTEYNNIYCIGIDLFEDFVGNPNNTHANYSTNKNEVENNIKNLGFNNDRFILMKNDTLIALSQLQELENCVIFIDANHKYWACLSDFLMVYHKFKNSYIIFHNSSIDGNIDSNYVSIDGGPNKVVKEIISNKKYNIEFIRQMDRSAIIKVK